MHLSTFPTSLQRQQRGPVLSDQYDELKRSDIHSVRSAIREGRYASHTAGLGAGHHQVNLVILPKSFARDFMAFCQQNPKPCPVTAVSDIGNPRMETLGADIDIRTDVPAYNIYRNGKLDRSVTDITDLWTDEMVTFALGCSFTFEHALQREGLPLWHVQNDTTVPMYRSNIPCTPAGPFRSDMVVSMRAIPADRVEDAIRISERYPMSHGAPVYWGDPGHLGIRDLSRPDWGDPAPVEEGQTPVFWACGVTPQVALEAAAPPICITHKPGHMLITDIPENADMPVFSSEMAKKLMLQQGDDT